LRVKSDSEAQHHRRPSHFGFSIGADLSKAAAFPRLEGHHQLLCRPSMITHYQIPSHFVAYTATRMQKNNASDPSCLLASSRARTEYLDPRLLMGLPRWREHATTKNLRCQSSYQVAYLTLDWAMVTHRGTMRWQQNGLLKNGDLKLHLAEQDILNSVGIPRFLPLRASRL